MYEYFEEPDLTITPGDWFVVNKGLANRTRREIEAAYPAIDVLYSGEPWMASYKRNECTAFELPDEDDLLRVQRDCNWVDTLRGAHQLMQFQVAYSFISLCRKDSHFADCTVWSCKYDIESFSKMYISEGAMILAAKFAGFDVDERNEYGTCRVNLLSDDVYCAMVNVLAYIRELVESVTGPNEYAGLCRPSLCMANAE